MITLLMFKMRCLIYNAMLMVLVVEMDVAGLFLFSCGGGVKKKFVTSSLYGTVYHGLENGAL